MKIADYVSKYLKESYDEPKGIENEDEAAQALRDLKGFFAGNDDGEDDGEDNEFVDDLDKMLMSMEDGDPMTDDELDNLLVSSKEEGVDAMEEGGCPGCKTAKVEKFCPDCGKKKVGDKEGGYDLKERKYDDNYAEDEGEDGHSDGYGKSGNFTHPDVPGIEFDSEGYDPEGKHISWWLSLEDGYVPKRKGMSEKTVMEKKLREYREAKKHKKSNKPKDVVGTDGSSDGSSEGE